MKQKLAVARAMLHRPQLLFLDEPTAGLDPEAAAALGSDLKRQVTQEGITVFLTTHNLAVAEQLCAQVGIIRQGKLLAVGPPDALRPLHENHAQVKQERPRLHEAYLALMRGEAP